MKRAIRLVMMIGAVFAVANTARGQAWEIGHARNLKLPGTGSDVSHSITLQAPALSSSATVTLPSSSLTFPTSNGIGVLTNDGAGSLSWVNLGSILSNPMTSAGDMIYGGLLGVPTRLAATTTANQVLLSGASGAPSWSTATFPATTTANQLLYSSSANTVTGLATANNGVLITSGAGVPSIASTLPSAVQGNITTTGTITGGTWNGTSIDLAHGGTNASLTASNGGIFYSTGTAGAILSGTGTAGQILRSGSSAAPSWSAATYPATTTANQLLYSSANNTIAGLTSGNNGVLITSGLGVPSISSTLPSAVQGNITSTGTITSGTWNGTTIDLAHGGTNASLTASNGGIFYSTGTAGAILSGTATANQMLLSGASAAPSWSTATYPATTTANQILYSSAANTVTGIASANNGVLITSGAGVPSISSTLPSAVQSNITATGTITSGTWNGTVVDETHGGTNQSNYATGDMLYASATNTMSKLTGNTTTTKKFLTQTGTGSLSQAPAWGTISSTDVSGLTTSMITGDSTTSSTSATPTGMSFAVGSNEIWAFECFMSVNNSGGTGSGVEVSMTLPSGATTETWTYGTGASGANSTAQQRISGGSSLTGQNFDKNNSSQDGFIHLSGVVSTGATSGTVVINYASSHNGTTVTLRKLSYLVARKM